MISRFIKIKTLLSFRNKSKRDFLVYGIGQAFNLLSPLVVAPYIISVCGEGGFGKVGFGFGLSLFLILIVDYAFEIKGIKEVAEKRDDLPALEAKLNLTLWTKITLFSVAAAIAGILIFGVGFFAEEKALFLFSMAIVFAQVFNPIWFLQGLENFSAASLLNIGSRVCYVAAVFIFVRETDDYILVNLLLGGSNLVFNLAGLLYVTRKFNFHLVKPNWHEIRNILSSDFLFCLSQLSLSVRQLSPLTLVVFFLGYEIAGIYRVLEQVITLFRTFIQVFLKFFYPKMSYLFFNDRKSGLLLWKRYTGFEFFAVFAALCVIYVFAPEILSYFNLSSANVESLTALFRLSLPISLLMAVSLPLEQLMFLYNKSENYIRVAIFVSVTNISIILVTISDIQLYGVIAALIVAELLFITLYAGTVFRGSPKRIS